MFCGVLNVSCSCVSFLCVSEVEVVIPFCSFLYISLSGWYAIHNNSMYIGHLQVSNEYSAKVASATTTTNTRIHVYYSKENLRHKHVYLYYASVCDTHNCQVCDLQAQTTKLLVKEHVIKVHT